MPGPVAPVAAANRLDVLDVLRGAAILGILLYNVAAFSGHDFVPPGGAPPRALASWDPAAGFAIEWLVAGKFYSLFSLLFGAGFAIFLSRAAAHGADAAALFRRRLTGLLLIGLVHSVFIWHGDILTVYAILGFLLLPFRRRSDRAVLGWAVALLASPIVLYAGLLALVRLAVPDAVLAGAPAGGMPPVFTDAVRAFASGSYPEVVAGNVVFTAGGWIRRIAIMSLPRIFGMFLLGCWMARRGLAADLDAARPLLRRVAKWGFALGLPLAAVGAALGASGVPRLPTPLGLVEMTVESVATPALSLAYAAAIALAFARPAARRRLMALAPVGRMALTNYLLQSVAGVIAFYGLGFGLFGTVSLVPCLAGAVALFAAQMVVSRWWLSRARFGPVEWLWRAFTYRRAPAWRPAGPVAG